MMAKTKPKAKATSAKHDPDAPMTEQERERIIKEISRMLQRDDTAGAGALQRHLYPDLAAVWMALPKDEVREAFTVETGGAILANASSPYYGVTTSNGKAPNLTKAYATAYVAQVLQDARDPLEEMLLQQMVWTHSRAAWLTTQANKVDNIKQLRAFSDAADHASNTFRRLMLGLSEYRNPRREGGFTAIHQLNAAAQQVVQNCGTPPNPENQNGKPSNEKEKPDGAPALPAYPGRPGVPTADHSVGEALAVDARAGDAAGQGAEQPQRSEARAAGRGGDRRAAGGGPVVEAVPDGDGR
jgi:hypothetical protein